MAFTHEDVERILKLIDESGYDEIRIECGELKVHVRRHIGAMPISDPVATGSAPDTKGSTRLATSIAAHSVSPSNSSASSVSMSPQLPADAAVVRAPMLGTFYRAESPGASPFVEVGSVVRVDTTVCLIEVMKLFNTLKAGVEGQVLQILVENGALVEFDQPLIVIEPLAPT